jgi:DNA polymerase-3 subunit epsilon
MQRAKVRPSAEELSFVAVDFETATEEPRSACSVGVVQVEGSRIVRAERRFLRPPEERFEFTAIHGLTWDTVANAPTFGETWPWLQGILAGADLLAAHNARFDARVMAACCEAAQVPAPSHSWICTVALAKQTWRQFPNTLSAVSSRLGIELDHHEALSDARACAQILLRAVAEGADWRQALVTAPSLREARLG